MTAVTVISEPRSMCSVPIPVQMPQDPAPLSAPRSPTWGEGQFTGSHSTEMETEAQEAEGAARGPAAGSAGVRTEPRVLRGEASPAHRSLESRDVTGLKSAGSSLACPLCRL